MMASVAGETNEDALPSRRRLQSVIHFCLNLTRRHALVFATSVALIAGIVDYFTTAEAVFTVFYLIPIFLAIWYRGIRPGYALIGLCSLLSVTVDLTVGPHRMQHLFVLWNGLGELGLYLLFAILIDGLKRRIATEAALRKETVKQLRHADRLATLGQLAAGLAHELGTPLNVVAGQASFITSGRLTGDAAKKSAATIERQATRMTTIIRQMLDFSRRGGAGRKATDLHQLAKETADLLRALAMRSRVTIECEGPSASDATATSTATATTTTTTTTTALVNASEMTQVLSNLVTNAIHAMPDGGTIRITSSIDDANIVLRVKDQGGGIPTHVLPHIFDPFFTTKDSGKGTGLGLSVVLGIVDDHGGTIEVETERGRGTTFVIRLPRAVDDEGRTGGVASERTSEANALTSRL